MRFTKVYRVEEEDGTGVYRNVDAMDIIYDWLGGDTSGGGRHPGPFSDSLLSGNFKKKKDEGRTLSEYNFGFASMKQFRAWFYQDDVLNKLGEEGMKLRVYKVPTTEVVRGNAQVVFYSDYHTPEYIERTIELASLVKT